MKTIEEIISIEPRIGSVLEGISRSGSYADYSEGKNKLECLVGWDAENFLLQNGEDYVTVMERLALKAGV
jgi:hypothetical protein